jgi:hypothetical protein
MQYLLYKISANDELFDKVGEVNVVESLLKPLLQHRKISPQHAFGIVSTDVVVPLGFDCVSRISNSLGDHLFRSHTTLKFRV